jgi:hypothetical protein
MTACLRILTCCVLVCGFAVGAKAAEARCQGNARVIGTCFVERGVVNLSFASGFVFSRAAEDQIGYAIEEDFPDAITRIFEADLNAYVVGTYKLCPIDGHSEVYKNQKFACVEAAQDLTVVKSTDQKKLCSLVVCRDYTKPSAK